MIDAKLEKNNSGVYDINITNSGDIEQTNGLDTAITCAILCNKRADESEVSDNLFIEGFTGDVYNDVEFGSKLWLLRQARVNTANLNRAKKFVNSSLNFLIDNGYANSIEVNGSVSINGISVTSKILTSTETVSNNITIWNNTLGID